MGQGHILHRHKSEAVLFSVPIPRSGKNVMQIKPASLSNNGNDHQPALVRPHAVRKNPGVRRVRSGFKTHKRTKNSRSSHVQGNKRE